tara:strand:+ start:122 stop:571 length:450 start_codon:yes stop_codon:yes gene_type:complete
MDQDDTALQKFTDLANAAHAHMAKVRPQSIPPVTLEEIEQAVAKSTVLPTGTATFIATHNNEFAAAQWLRNLDEAEARVEAGIPFTRPQGHPGLPTTLHLAALEWARARNLKSIHTFVDHRDTHILAACQATDFERRLVMPIMELELPT